MSKILRKFSLQIPSFQTYEDVLKMDAPLLTKGLDEFLSLELPSWTKSGQKIEKNYEFINFKQTFGFMTEVALFADYIDHHPDWSNVYNKLQVRLNSHYCNGITMRDLFLAYTMVFSIKKLY